MPKISALPAGVLSSTEEFAVNDSGTTKKVTLATLLSQVTGIPPRTALDQTTWSWDNQGTSTIAQGSGIVRFVIPTNVSENLRVRHTSAPVTTPYLIRSLMVPNAMAEINFVGFGICFRESATGKLVSIFLQTQGTNTVYAIRKNTTSTVFASGSPTGAISPTGGFYFRIGNTGVTTTYEYSQDGVNFDTLLSEPKGTFFTVGPDQAGIMGFNLTGFNGQAASYLSWDIS